MIEIRPKGYEVIDNNEKIKLLLNSGYKLDNEDLERLNKIQGVTSADKKIEICERVYEQYDPWTFDGDEKDVIINTIIDPFGAIEFLLDTIDSILG